MPKDGAPFRSIYPFLAVLAFGSSAQALQEVDSSFPIQFQGRIYTDHYLFTQGTKAATLQQSSASLWLEANGQISERIGAKIVGEINGFYRDINSPESPSYQSRLREGYLSYSSNGFELRAGEQIIPWGKSDGINPTDYFTSKDYTLLNPDDEVRRRGAPGANLSFTPDEGTSPFNFQLVFQTDYPEMKLLIPDQSIPQGISFRKYPVRKDLFSQNSMEYGIKVSYMKPSFDFSVSAYRGYSHFSEYIYDSTSHSVVPINPAETAIGGDASFTLSHYVIRLESAVHMPENGTDTDPLFGSVQPWHWDSVVGAERPLGDHFRIQAQFLYRWHLYFPNSVVFSNDPITNQILLGVARANSLILNYQQQGNPGATFRLSYQNENSNWSADALLFGYFGGGQDYLFRPQLGYTPVTNLKFTTGLDLYGGDQNRPLGALRDQSHAFIEGKYVF